MILSLYHECKLVHQTPLWYNIIIEHFESTYFRGMDSMQENTGKRLNKFIADSGYCSRREADRLIEEGRVQVDGRTGSLGDRVLDGMTARNARWYYLSSLANQGLGNSIDALQDARRAVQLDPNNTEYQMHLRRMQNPGQTYRTQTTYAQPGGLLRWCWSMILLNLLCNCCCGGWGFRGFRM